ncbi:MAG: hypothetical protein ACYTGS_15770 [Planctomycetota bacterium]|jgi:hypothetical protein
MAVGDIFATRVNCSTNNRAWSFGLWLEEVSPASPTDEGRVISDALHAHINTQLVGMLSNESCFESVQAWRRHPEPCRPGYTKVTGGTGGRVGDAAPNDNAMYISLRQVAQDAKHNGGIYVSGFRDDDLTNNEWNGTFLLIQVKAFTDVLDDLINAVGGDSGQWRVVVLSKSFAPPTTPIGTPFDVVEAIAANRVMSQRRRAQKVQGYTISAS